MLNEKTDVDLGLARWAAESVFGEEQAGREPPPDAEAVTGT